MAVTLVSTISGETSNSYCDLTFADDYFDNHYSVAKATVCQALSDGQKEQLLVQACRVIERARFTEPVESSVFESEMEWRRDLGQVITVNKTTRPFRYSNIQSLQFPRNYDVLSDGTIFIPEELKMAQCEQAVYLAAVDESTLNNAMQGLRRESITVGEISISQTYSEGSASSGGTLFSPIAKELITPYLIKSSSRIERA